MAGSQNGGVGVLLHRPGIEPGANGPHEARFELDRARLATINFTTKPTVPSTMLLIPGFEPGTFRVLSGRYDQLNHTSRER